MQGKADFAITNAVQPAPLAELPCQPMPPPRLKAPCGAGARWRFALVVPLLIGSRAMTSLSAAVASGGVRPAVSLAHAHARSRSSNITSANSSANVLYSAQ
jgi:hypothetical protein